MSRKTVCEERPSWSRRGYLRPASAGLPVLIVDDHELFAETLRLALCRAGLAARRAPATSVTAVTRAATESSPGLVVLDLNLGSDRDTGEPLSPIRLCRALMSAGWRVLVVSGSRDPELEAATIAAGAIGTVPKTSSFGALLATVQAASDGRTLLTPDERAEWSARNEAYQRERSEGERRLERLSSREWEVLELLAEGRRAAQIAEHFVVSLTTVRAQIRSILSKLDCGSQIEAVAVANRWSATRRS